MISENFNDFYKDKKSLNILVKASIKIIMEQENQQLNPIKNSFELTTGECDFLKNCATGEGIIKIDGNSAQLSVVPIEEEMSFAATTKKRES